MDGAAVANACKNVILHEKFYGNSLICLKCDEKVEQQTNSFQKLDCHSFDI